MSSPVERQVQLQDHQRTLVWRQNHGWVRTKRCGFCNGMCHLDDLGVWSFGKTYHSRHTWYCGVQCAKHINPVYLKALLTPKSERRAVRS